jgi:nitrate reductase NapE component
MTKNSKQGKNRNKPKVIPQKKQSKIGIFLLKKVWGLILILASIGGAIGLIVWIYDVSKSNHDKFIEYNYITGISAPFAAYEKLTINTGGMTFSAKIPPNGILDNVRPIFGQVDKSNSAEDEFNYGIKIIDHRFLLSIVLKDFKTGEIIA